MSSQFPLQRRRMIDSQLRPSDVSDVAVLAAMGEVAREGFVPDARRAVAYMDEDLELRASQGARPARYLMEPTPFAKLLQLAAVRPGEVVLDVGCASGYSSAILSHMGATVVALEEDGDLAATARDLLAREGFEAVTVVEGPLAKGHVPQAPYDVIVVEGAVETVPETLLSQLGEGGRLVAVVGSGHAAVGTLFLKTAGVIGRRGAFNAAVEKLPGFGAEPTFQF